MAGEAAGGTLEASEEVAAPTSDGGGLLEKEGGF